MKEAAMIRPIDKEAVRKSKYHWDHIAKPLNGLGKMEKLVSKIAGIQGKEEVEIKKKAIVVMCSDNGVCCEGVTQTGKEVTAIVTENFAKGITSVNAMSKAAGADVFPVDIGVDGDLKEPDVLKRKVAYGTNNIKTGPAMTKEQARKAIHIGIDIVRTLKQKGYEIIGTGEMGIGNTTTSSAVASVLLNVDPAEVTGKGAGLSYEGILHKTEVIREAIRVNQPDRTDSIDILSKVGGFDIAGLMGVFLGGAMYHIPIVIDGVISAAAALLAKQAVPVAVEYMIPSHLGKEPAAALIMKELGLEPVIHAELALGEGTGAVLLFPLLDLTMSVYNQNKTFDEIDVEAYHSFDNEEAT